MTTPSCRRHVAPRRAGFTIIELLMVILIISVLAALLFPAIQGAIHRSQEAEVTVEIKGLVKGMTDFKGRYGVEPPSFIVLYEQGSDWAPNNPAMVVSNAHHRASRAAIRQIWPDFDYTYAAAGGNIDINGNGSSNDVLLLNGAECLVFFLGGVTDRVALPSNPMGWQPVGFAANPQYPFVKGGNRFGPFLDFDADRLIDIDALRNTGRNSEMPEYLDTLPGQQFPYQYLSSYDGRGYQPYGLDGLPGASATDPLAFDNELQQASFGFNRIYYQSPPFLPAQWVSPVPPQLDMDGNGMPETVARPFNPDTFQIISAGRDYDFGTGGFYNDEMVPSDRPTEHDNITNFKGGRLN